MGATYRLRGKYSSGPFRVTYVTVGTQILVINRTIFFYCLDFPLFKKKMWSWMSILSWKLSTLSIPSPAFLLQPHFQRYLRYIQRITTCQIFQILQTLWSVQMSAFLLIIVWIPSISSCHSYFWGFRKHWNLLMGNSDVMCVRKNVTCVTRLNCV